MVELVDTLDSKSDEHYARAGSSPARGTIIILLEDCLGSPRDFYLVRLALKASSGLSGLHSQ